MTKPAKYGYQYHEGKSLHEGIYCTKRKGTTNQTDRYWDGSKWWSQTCDFDETKKPLPTVLTQWSEPGQKKFEFTGHNKDRLILALVKYRFQENILWALPKAIYSDTQILNFLTKTTWMHTRDCYNKLMSQTFNEPTGDRNG